MAQGPDSSFGVSKKNRKFIVGVSKKYIYQVMKGPNCAN